MTRLSASGKSGECEIGSPFNLNWRTTLINSRHRNNDSTQSVIASYFIWLQCESFDGDERTISIGEDNTRLINNQISVIVSGVWCKPHNRSKCWLTRVIMARACSLRFCAKIRANSHQTSATFISNAISGKNANEHFPGNDFFFSLVELKSDELHSPGELSNASTTSDDSHKKATLMRLLPYSMRSGDGVEKTQFNDRLKSREFSGTRNATALQRNSWNCVQWYADWKSDILHAQINATWICLLIKLNANKQNSFINDDENEMIIKLLWLRLCGIPGPRFIDMQKFSFNSHSSATGLAFDVSQSVMQTDDRFFSFCDALWQLGSLGALDRHGSQPASGSFINEPNFINALCYKYMLHANLENRLHCKISFRCSQIWVLFFFFIFPVICEQASVKAKMLK